MSGTNLFYQYYDLLFSDKKYRNEVDTVWSIAEIFAAGSVSKMLEIGCGTGNHTLEFAQKKAEMVAIDTDPEMIARARAKGISQGYPNVALHCTPVEQLQESGFDLAVALFNVVTYISSTDALLSFFHGVYRSLKPGGIFIFDCWNGIAAIKDPPFGKSIMKKDGDNTVVCDLIPRTDCFHQVTTLEYRIKVSDEQHQQIDSDVFGFDQTLWTHMQIEYCIEKSNLHLIRCCKNFDVENLPSEEDRTLMFICQKKP